MEAQNELDKEPDALDGDVMESPGVSGKKKRPRAPSLSPNPDHSLQQQMELMNKAATERAAARAIEKQSEEDRATKRRNEDREYYEQREAAREKREQAREDARLAQAAESTAVTSALLAFLTAQTQPRAPP